MPVWGALRTNAPAGGTKKRGWLMPAPVTVFTVAKSLPFTLRATLKWPLFCAVAVVQARRTAAPSAVLAVKVLNPTSSGAALSSKTLGRIACGGLPLFSALSMNVVEFRLVLL